MSLDPPPDVVKVDEKDLKEGEGAYSPETKFVLLSSRAQAVLLIILDGDRGTGFDIAIRADCVDNVEWAGLARELDRLAGIVRRRGPEILREAAGAGGGGRPV